MSLLCLLSTETELRAGLPDLACWLSDTERARLASFGTTARRDSFVAGRWLARQVLRQWQGAADWPVLEVADSGACRVASGDAFVSISHSGGYVACAVAGVPVGVDVESTMRPRDHLALAAVVHTQAQRDALASLPPEARPRGFLQDWTLKEAWLKARGRGLDFALMRTLSFDEDAQGNVAVTDIGELVLTVAADPVLPADIVGVAGADWRRWRTRS